MMKTIFKRLKDRDLTELEWTYKHANMRKWIYFALGFVIFIISVNSILTMNDLAKTINDPEIKFHVVNVVFLALVFFALLITVELFIDAKLKKLEQNQLDIIVLMKQQQEYDKKFDHILELITKLNLIIDMDKLTKEDKELWINMMNKKSIS